MTYSDTSLDVNVDNIPKRLKDYPQWVGWVFETTDYGFRTKVPKHIINKYTASTKNSKHWVDFETCLQYIDNFDGIGFVVSKDDPFVIWDLDDCYSQYDGHFSSEANDIKNRLNSYTEFSPSGKGLRIIVKGTIGPFGNRNNLDKIEVYDSKHYLTITGHHVGGTPKVIKKRHKICAELHEKYLITQITNIINQSKKNFKKWSAYKSGGTKLFE